MKHERRPSGTASEGQIGGEIDSTLSRTLRLDYHGKLTISGGMSPSPLVVSIDNAHLTVPRSAVYLPGGWPTGCNCKSPVATCSCLMLPDPGVRVTLRGTLTETPFLPWSAR